MPGPQSMHAILLRASPALLFASFRLPTMQCNVHCCRLLGLDPEAQAILFDFYSAVLDALMERARREGTLGERLCRGVHCALSSSAGLACAGGWVREWGESGGRAPRGSTSCK